MKYSNCYIKLGSKVLKTLILLDKKNPVRKKILKTIKKISREHLLTIIFFDANIFVTQELIQLGLQEGRVPFGEKGREIGPKNLWVVEKVWATTKELLVEVVKNLSVKVDIPTIFASQQLPVDSDVMVEAIAHIYPEDKIYVFTSSKKEEEVKTKFYGLKNVEVIGISIS